jgi:hypothetical protein
MSTPLVSLIEFLGARVSCPVCGAGRVEANLTAQWSQHRAIFTCEAIFIARGEEIVVERACGERSRLAADLWTREVPR